MPIQFRKVSTQYLPGPGSTHLLIPATGGRGMGGERGRKT